MAADAEGDAWTWAALEPEPTEREKALLDTFCQEFLVDGNHVAAASRCGFQSAFAPEYGERFIKKAYVQKRLRALREAEPEAAAESRYNKRIIMNTLREVATNQYAKHSARVAAAAELARIEGLHQIKEDPNAEGTGGGVILLPAIANLESWEAAAAASQDALAEASRVS